MKKTKQICQQAAFAMTAFLLFLLAFEQMVVVPEWLGPAARMHPLVLHLPIGFAFVLALVALLRDDSPGVVRFESFLLHLTVVMALITALSGFFWQQISDYDLDVLRWHKWSGIAVALIGYCSLYLYKQPTRRYYNLSLLAWMGSILLAGHLGGEITHGDNFVFGRNTQQETLQVDEDTPVYAALVKPILQEKCISCHRQGKAKGDLNMETAEHLMAGGEGGATVVAGDAQSSEMMRRIHLPHADDDHMPPKGKAQLTEEEKATLEDWIESGADFTRTLAQYEDSTYHALFRPRMESLFGKSKPTYRFVAADDELIQTLNTPFRTVAPLNDGSPALHATLFVRAAYQPQMLRDLEKLRKQLVQLTLTNLPICDDDLSFIGQFENLEKLILNGTDVTGATIGDLSRCSRLASLGLSSSALRREHVGHLASLSSLRVVSVWNTDVRQEDIDQKALQHIDFEFGFQPDPDDTLTLSKPLLVNDKSILSPGEQVALRSMFAGVETHYTLDGSEPTRASAKYDGALTIGEEDVLKARAFKDGWAPSETATYTFYRLGESPTDIELLTFPNPRYRAEGATTLYDGEKGQANGLRTPYWLGYQGQPLEALISFDKEQELSRIIISSAQNIGMWVMPPQEVILWGGSDEEHLVELARVVPQQPEEGAKTKEVPIQITIPKAHYPYLKVSMNPVNSLPKWHQGSGQEGWVFTDEILFYSD